MKTKFFSILLMLLSASLVPAVNASKNIRFEHLTTTDGLSHMSITDLLQDAQGFMWFATQEGLNRFDGYSITTFEHDYRNANSLADDWVWSLALDADNNIWVGTNNGGLNYFDQKTGSFTNWKHRADDPQSLSSNDVRVLLVDSQGSLWLGTHEGGLSRKLPDNAGFMHYRATGLPGSLPSDAVTEIYEDTTGILWIGTAAGLARFDPRTDQFQTFVSDPTNENSLSDSHIRVVQEFNGELWVGTQNGGVNRFDQNTGRSIRYIKNTADPRTLQSNLVRDIMVDHASTLWLGTENGLSEWQPETEDFVTYYHVAEDSSSLIGSRVNALYQDSSNVMWVGTYEGLSRWNYLSSAFSYYTQADGQLGSDLVFGITQSPNETLWVGTYGAGISRLEPLENGAFKSIAYAVTLPDQRVMTLWAQDDNNLWIGTRTAGLCHLTVATKAVSCLSHDVTNPNSLSANGITSLLGESGTLWIGTYGGGLNRLDRRTNIIRHFRFNDKDDQSLGSDRVLAIFRDSQGTLWIGTESGGLNRYNAAADNFTRYTHSDGIDDSLSNDTVWEIFESKDGSMWFGTLNGGLNVWPAIARAAGIVRFEHYDRIAGLQSNTIYGILEDEAGYIWMSSNRGLARLNPMTKEIRHYDRRNGTRGDEFNFGARLKNQAGQLFFGSANGLVGFDAADIYANRNPPAVIINGVSSLNRKVFAHSSQSTPSNIVLDYNERQINFEFAALDYASPDKNLYEYRLVDFDDSWLKAEGFRRATYTSLPAGRYTFRVRASNNDQVWNMQGAAIELLVVPPPWLTWWAYLTYVCLIVSTLVTYVVLQRRKLLLARQQHLILEGLIRQRTGELAEQNDQLEMVNDQLRKASMTDALTGLHNRRYLYDYLENQVALMQRHMTPLEEGVKAQQAFNRGSTLFFMMIGLDGFKNINDSFGHPAGDQALIQVCDILLKHTRDSDTLIRWDGDEFLIVGCGHGLDGPNQLAERIRKDLVGHTFSVGHGAKAYMTGSIGFAPYPFNSWHPNRFNWEQVLAIADQAAYVAKANGKNAWLGLEGSETFNAHEFMEISTGMQRLVDEERVTSMTSMVNIVNFDA
ncbi:MAG: diguanylate cyclase (GGDEF)-like protein [Saprospiraceae bacterium]